MSTQPAITSVAKNDPDKCFCFLSKIEKVFVPKTVEDDVGIARYIREAVPCRLRKTLCQTRETIYFAVTFKGRIFVFEVLRNFEFDSVTTLEKLKAEFNVFSIALKAPKIRPDSFPQKETIDFIKLFFGKLFDPTWKINQRISICLRLGMNTDEAQHYAVEWDALPLPAEYAAKVNFYLEKVEAWKAAAATWRRNGRQGDPPFFQYERLKNELSQITKILVQALIKLTGKKVRNRAGMLPASAYKSIFERFQQMRLTHSVKKDSDIQPLKKSTARKRKIQQVHPGNNPVNFGLHMANKFKSVLGCGPSSIQIVNMDDNTSIEIKCRD